jgi:small ligand-binding sensory domain FIST
MPGVRILPFVIDQNDVNESSSVEFWHEHIGAGPDDKPGFVILPEPFSIDAETLLAELDVAYPASKIVGGMSSGANGPNQNRLFLNDQVLRQGLVGVSLSGPVELHPVVSQGCRPIGEPFVVTKAEQNVIFELRGRPALDVLRGVFNDAPASEQALMQQGLHVGNVVDERLEKFGQGDFLIRNLMGVVQESGLAVNALVRPGQTIQFHVRDSASADEDMRRMLDGTLATMGKAPTGGLLFSCNGRGARMFGKPNHDIGVVNNAAKGCQVAGFFAGGEIGPVGRRTFIHGFTSSLVLFREPA